MFARICMCVMQVQDNYIVQSKNQYHCKDDKYKMRQFYIWCKTEKKKLLPCKGTL